jgi:hypothetical protein
MNPRGFPPWRVRQSTQGKDEAMSTTKQVSRRTIVSGAAALPAIAVCVTAVAATEPDPIFAAIAAHRSAWAALCRDCSRLDEEDTPEAQTKLSKLHDAVSEAEEQLIEIEPTTMAGAITLLRYLAEFQAVGDVFDGHSPEQTYFFDNLATALERLPARA